MNDTRDHYHRALEHEIAVLRDTNQHLQRVIDQLQDCIFKELESINAANKLMLNYPALWEIAQMVAEREPTYDDDFTNTYCMYCYGETTLQGYEHEPTCIYLKAKALIKPKEQAS